MADEFRITAWRRKKGGNKLIREGGLEIGTWDIELNRIWRYHLWKIVYIRGVQCARLPVCMCRTAVCACVLYSLRVCYMAVYACVQARAYVWPIKLSMKCSAKYENLPLTNRSLISSPVIETSFGGTSAVFHTMTRKKYLSKGKDIIFEWKHT